MHRFVTYLLCVAAYDSVTYDAIVREFELEENELDEFVTWVKRRNFATISDATTDEPFIQITADGTKWVLRQLWDFSSNEYTDDI